MAPAAPGAGEIKHVGPRPVIVTVADGPYAATDLEIDPVTGSDDELPQAGRLMPDGRRGDQVTGTGLFQAVPHAFLLDLAANALRVAR